jgi:hypothetical protein
LPVDRIPKEAVLKPSLSRLSFPLAPIHHALRDEKHAAGHVFRDLAVTTVPETANSFMLTCERK